MSLRVRPGARFTCHGDGLCCADVHTFGPLDDREVATLEALDRRLVVLTEEGDRVIAATGGRCAFLGEGGCALHARLGPRAKPVSCQQFPFVLIETPTHRRVATDHRCPCRTMGERAPVTAEAAAEACPGPPDRTLLSTFALTEGVEITIEEWEAIEETLLARLATEDPLEVLGAVEIDREPLEALGRLYVSQTDESRFVVAIRRFGRALLDELGLPVEGAVEAPAPTLPWADAFDRAEARSAPEDPEAMLRDWVADYLWSLEHAFLGTFADARAELSLRVRIARRLAAERAAEGARPDRAMAEAIAIVELAGVEDDYRDFASRAAAG